MEIDELLRRAAAAREERAKRDARESVSKVLGWSVFMGVCGAMALCGCSVGGLLVWIWTHR
jgi:hypothetical protein